MDQELVCELHQYVRMLPVRERDLLEKLLAQGMRRAKHFSRSRHPLDFVLLAVIVEQQKQINALEELYETIAESVVG